MRVILSTPTFDPLVPVELNALDSSDQGASRRRVNRVATLDGGVVVNDFGFTDADRTVELRWVPTSADAEALITRLLRTYTRLVVAMRDGVFEAAPDTYTPSDADSRLKLLLLRKLST